MTIPTCPDTWQELEIQQHNSGSSLFHLYPFFRLFRGVLTKLSTSSVCLFFRFLYSATASTQTSRAAIDDYWCFSRRTKVFVGGGAAENVPRGNLNESGAHASIDQLPTGNTTGKLVGGGLEAVFGHHSLLGRPSLACVHQRMQEKGAVGAPAENVML